jgi:hypothetical protein
MKTNKNRERQTVKERQKFREKYREKQKLYSVEANSPTTLKAFCSEKKGLSSFYHCKTEIQLFCSKLSVVPTTIFSIILFVKFSWLLINRKKGFFSF